MEAAGDEGILRVGELSIRFADAFVVAGGRPVALSLREFQLLAALARRPHRIISRGELYAEVWGGPLRRGDRSVDVYVYKLRSKLEQALPRWRYIHTHHGFGYRFAPEPSHGFHIPATAR